MAALDKLLKIIDNAQIASAAIYPTKPYTGSLPTANVKKGSKGKSVKAVQQFLNWCIKAGLTVDGVCGNKTVSAIKKYQKQYKLKVDGVFGPASLKKAKAIIKKYAVNKAKDTTSTSTKTTPASEPVKTEAVKTETWVDKANTWAKAIAADNTYHYVKWSSNTKTHECPICKKHSIGKYHGWNCIGFAWAVWHHGGKLGNKCKCDVISNGVANQMLKCSSSQALAIAKQKSGLSKIKVIRNKNGIPKSQWKAGDICLKFKGNTYTHTFYYMGNGKVCDSTSAKNNDKQIAVRSYKNYSAKIIIRYTGK